VAVTIVSFGLFSQNLWLDTSVPWISIALTFLVGVMGRARRQARDSTHITSTINALTRVSDIIAAQTRQWDLLDRVLSFATQALGASGATALILDDRQTLTVAAAIGPHADQTLGVQIKIGDGIAGYVAQSGEAIMTNDASEHPYFSTVYDNNERLYSNGQPTPITHNLICVPLKVRERILGVIKVVNRENNAPFSKADVELLGAVANQAAVALDNARLYDRLAQRVEQSQGALAMANRQLQADKNLLQTVLLSMTDGIVVTDGAGLIQLVNPAAQNIVPELSGNVLGEPLETIVKDFPLANLEHYRRENYIEEVVSLFRGETDSPRHIEARAAPLQTPDGEFAGLVAVFADITQRRQIEQAKSDFVSFVAHEMRSPLTSISGFSSMLQRAEASPNGGTLPVASKARFLGLIHQESERLTRLINSLLDVAKLEAGQIIELNRDEVDFAQIANFCIDSQRAYSSRHTISASFNSRLPLIYADADKVTQILINLISNALKYSPGGKVVLGANVQGQWIEVSVKDDGPGIPPQQKAVLFSRFGRTATQATGTGARSKPTGTGLGLFLTKHFVEQHGGRIWVDSEPDQGATFFFTLPLAVKQENKK
jgi:PAS domain S-box-containing protein